MGNFGSTATEDKKKQEDNMKKNNKKKAEKEDLWIPTPTTTSVFSEMDKHSYAADMFEADNLKPIDEECEYEDRESSLKNHKQNGIGAPGENTHYTMSSTSLNVNAARVSRPETLVLHSNRLVYRHKPDEFTSEGNICRSMGALNIGTNGDINGNNDRFAVNRYSGTLHGNNHYRSNPALNSIPVARLERVPPQRSMSMRLEAGPWPHQKPTFRGAPPPPANHHTDYPKQGVKVKRRSSWTPSTSRFKKIFLLNKPEDSLTNSGPIYHRSISADRGERVFQRTADGQVVAISPESSLRTSQWVAQHSVENLRNPTPVRQQRYSNISY